MGDAARVAIVRSTLGTVDTTLKPFPDGIRRVVFERHDRFVRPLIEQHWPESLQQRAGQVVPMACPVGAEVLPKIDQLQGTANGVAALQGQGVGHTVQVQQQAAHGVGGALAVTQQFIGVCVAVLDIGEAHVLLKGVEQSEQQVSGQLVRLHGSVQG
jgi:hypothetical protein